MLATRHQPEVFFSLINYSNPSVRPAWSPDDSVIALPGRGRVATEMVFLDTLWPDFTRADLWQAIEHYTGRTRRFGGAVDAPKP